MEETIQLVHLYISRGHNFVGHHGRPPGQHEIHEVDRLDCRSGEGIYGDRFFGHKQNFKGQITFFAYEVYLELCRELNVSSHSPAAFRRNVITHGVDLNSLIGREFEIQGIRFFGTEECRPCYWMDQAFAPGAEAFLRGKGGLRAKILSSGVLKPDRTGRVALVRQSPVQST